MIPQREQRRLYAAFRSPEASCHVTTVNRIGRMQAVALMNTPAKQAKITSVIDCIAHPRWYWPALAGRHGSG
jgi:hypothetical protein